MDQLMDVLSSELFLSVLVIVLTLILRWRKVDKADEAARTIADGFRHAVQAVEKLRNSELAGASHPQLRAQALYEAKEYIGDRLWKKEVAGSEKTLVESALYDMQRERDATKKAAAVALSLASGQPSGGK